MWLARSVRDRLQQGKRGEGLLKQIKITAMTVFVTDIPVRLMRRHGSGDVAGSVKNAILKLETDAGLTGWGDAAPWAVFTGTIEANVAALHVYLRPLLIGADPHRIEDLMVAADHAVVGHPEAKAAIEMALFDIVGQASGLPVAELLGGRCRDDIPLSFSVADPDVDRTWKWCSGLRRGATVFKMKTGLRHAGPGLRSGLPQGAAGRRGTRIDYNQVR
jgi:muconate cycloisomerase